VPAAEIEACALLFTVNRLVAKSTTFKVPAFTVTLPVTAKPPAVFNARAPPPAFTKEPLPEMTLSALPAFTVSVPFEATATVPPLKVPMDAVKPFNAKLPPLT